MMAYLHRDEDHLVAAGSNLMEDQNTSATHTIQNPLSTRTQFELLNLNQKQSLHLQRVVGEGI